MTEDQFNLAVSIRKEIERYKEHRNLLIKSNIQYDGGLIFHYNDHYPDVKLIYELFGGKDFFKTYMDNLEAKISELENKFKEL